MAVSGLAAIFLLSLSTTCWAVTTTVLPPRRGANDSPAGLLILPGAYLLADQYTATGEAIQAASDQRLWVGLSGDFIADIVNPIEVPEALEDGVRRLRQAGLPEDAPVFVAGHSLAGVFLPGPALEQAGVRGLVMMASYLPEGDLATYNLPVLSVSGDLDGQTRLTRIVKSFREVDAAVRRSGDVSLQLKYPVAVLTDVNHAQFATGKMPAPVEEEDIPSPLDPAKARKRIAAVVAAFISYQTQKDLPSQERLQQAWSTTDGIVKPFMELMSQELNEDKTSSSWVSQAQRIISTLSEGDLTLVDVYNKIYEADVGFPRSKPEVKVVRGRLVVNTTTNVRYGLTTISLNPQTADEIEAKMKRQEALKQEAEKGGMRLGFGTPVSCREANRAAWERALGQASDIARSRFVAKNIEVNFESDDMAITGPGFLMGRLTFNLQGRVLTIKSVSLVTDVDMILGVAGMHYCKLLSPARALEFIYVDALKNQNTF